MHRGSTKGSTVLGRGLVLNARSVVLQVCRTPVSGKSFFKVDDAPVCAGCIDQQDGGDDAEDDDDDDDEDDSE